LAEETAVMMAATKAESKVESLVVSWVEHWVDWLEAYWAECWAANLDWKKVVMLGKTSAGYLDVTKVDLMVDSMVPMRAESKADSTVAQ
jgi:hypothetical protein